LIGFSSNEKKIDLNINCSLLRTDEDKNPVLTVDSGFV